MPSSSSTPRALQRFSVRFVIHSVNSANGIESGRASMITTGWMKLSNCAASTMYTKIIASAIAMIRFAVVSSRMRVCPVSR